MESTVFGSPESGQVLLSPRASLVTPAVTLPNPQPMTTPALFRNRHRRLVNARAAAPAGPRSCAHSNRRPQPPHISVRRIEVIQHVVQKPAGVGVIACKHSRARAVRANPFPR